MAQARALKKNFHTEMAVAQPEKLQEQVKVPDILLENNQEVGGLSLKPENLEPMNVSVAQSEQDATEPVVQKEVSQQVDTKDHIEEDKLKYQQANFKALREEKARAERERDALLAQLLAVSQKQQTDPVAQPTTEDIDVSLNDDDLVDGKSLKKMAKKVQQLTKKLEESHHQNYNAIVESRIKADFPDIERVASEENIEYLKAKFPFIASSLSSTPDLYNKAAATYTMIKSLGIYKDPNFQDSAKIKQNLEKPRTLTSITPQQGETPLSSANAFAQGLTPQLKAQLLKEMSAYRKER